MRRALLALAFIATAGTAYAQTTMSTPASAPVQPMPAPDQPMPGPAAGATDANGQPIIGRNDWVRQPGDRAGPGAQSPSTNPNMAAAPAPARVRASGAGQPGPDGTFRDEYGFRYDAQGNRIDGRGKILPPPMSRQ